MSKSRVKINKHPKISPNELRQQYKWEAALQNWICFRRGESYHSLPVARKARNNCILKCDICGTKVAITAGEFVSAECWRCGCTDVRFLDKYGRELKMPIAYFWIPPQHTTYDAFSYTNVDAAIDFDRFLYQVSEAGRLILIEYYCNLRSYRETAKIFSMDESSIRDIVKKIRYVYVKGE